VVGGYTGGRPGEILDRVEGLDSVWHESVAGIREHVAGVPGLPEAWGDERFDLAGAAFLQVNRSAAALLEDHVIDLAGDVSGLRVIDAYCGIGLQARRLARAGALVTGIELDPAAVRIASAGIVEGARFRSGAVEDLLGQELPADLLLLNPPRAGVHQAVIDQIRSSPPERLIYISCDPATLARDLKRLEGVYAIGDLHCFDLFPQTSHVETVVELRRLRADF
jgi:23S rRNA (uracil1939-C5)-methyltransferase